MATGVLRPCSRITATATPPVPVSCRCSSACCVPGPGMASGASLTVNTPPPELTQRSSRGISSLMTPETGVGVQPLEESSLIGTAAWLIGVASFVVIVHAGRVCVTSAAGSTRPARRASSRVVEKPST